MAGWGDELWTPDSVHKPKTSESPRVSLQTEQIEPRRLSFGNVCNADTGRSPTNPSERLRNPTNPLHSNTLEQQASALASALKAIGTPEQELAQCEEELTIQGLTPYYGALMEAFLIGEQTAPSTRMGSSHGKTNRTDCEKANTMLAADDVLFTYKYLRGSTTRDHTQKGKTVARHHKCVKKVACALTTNKLDPIWIEQTREHYCSLKRDNKRSYVYNLLRNENKASGPMRLDEVTLRGVKLCLRCLQVVLKVSSCSIRHIQN